MTHKLRKAKKIVVTGAKTALYPRKSMGEFKKRARRRAINNQRQADYRHWFKHHQPTAADLKKQRTIAKNFKLRPLVSIVMPIYDTPEAFLRACIDSVLSQTYDNWELCIADDASPSDIIEVVKEYAAKHTNVKWTRLEKNQHIAGSSNEALKLAAGEFVALLDHDDLLMPNALFEMVSALNGSPKADFFYSDEDKIEDGVGRLEPFFKPDWSPEFLKSCNYITHFSMLRKSIIDKIGGFRLGTEGAQDWDLFLRFTEQTQKVVHIPKILYAWRKSPTSTAQSADSKPYAYLNQRSVLREAVRQGPISASVFDHPSRGFWRVRYQIVGNPKVSIVIPTKDNFELIKQCIYSIIDKTSYANFEIVLVDSGSTDPQVLDFYKSKLVVNNNAKVHNWKAKQFNFSAACNYGAKQATGEYLIFLNNDTEVITCDWIESLLEYAQQTGVGMVGAQLLFPNDTVQHAGVVLSERDVAFHPFYGLDPSLDIFTNIYIANIRDCSAVTAACSMIQKKRFDEVKGFDTKLRVTYNDVDLCLRLGEAGYRNIYTPNARLYHHESMSVGKITGGQRDNTELQAAADLMRQRWAKQLRRDPYYNDNFKQFGPGYQV
jgi:GT2 family glycosyltransferase